MPTVKSKVFENAEAALFDLADGISLMSGGFGLCGIPENSIKEIRRQSIKQIHAISNNIGNSGRGLAWLLKEKQIKTMDQTEHSTVGIERYCCTAATRTQAKQSKQQRIKSVLQEQMMQKVLGVHDPEIIREIAQHYSRDARDKALQLAARLVH